MTRIPLPRRNVAREILRHKSSDERRSGLLLLRRTVLCRVNQIAVHFEIDTWRSIPDLNFYRAASGQGGDNTARTNINRTGSRNERGPQCCRSLQQITALRIDRASASLDLRTKNARRNDQ